MGLGVDAVNILNKYHLKNTDDYENLINIYEGNPKYLQIIGCLIEDLFAGNINEFLKLEQPFIDGELSAFLEQSLDILPQLEIELLNFIANQNRTILFSQLQEKYNLTEQIVSIIQSLKRRFLLSTRQINDEVSLEISPVIRKFYQKIDKEINQ